MAQIEQAVCDLKAVVTQRVVNLGKVPRPEVLLDLKQTAVEQVFEPILGERSRLALIEEHLMSRPSSSALAAQTLKGFNSQYSQASSPNFGNLKAGDAQSSD